MARTLNSVLFPVMVDPHSLATPPTVFLSGDEDDARATVATLLADLGWPAGWIIDRGDITTARGPKAIMLRAPSIARRYGFAPFTLTITR